MKKAFALLAAVALLMTAGCRKAATTPGTPPTAPARFSANVKAVFGEAEMTAVLTRSGETDYSLKILTPEILAPLTLHYTDGKCEVEYDELKFETDLTRFPQTEFGALLTGAMTSVCDGIDITSACADGVWTYTGTSERGVFTLTQSAESGEWLEFSVEGALLHVTFSDFKINKKAAELDALPQKNHIILLALGPYSSLSVERTTKVLVCETPPTHFISFTSFSSPLLPSVHIFSRKSASPVI